jgi:hypothetical protein
VGSQLFDNPAVIFAPRPLRLSDEGTCGQKYHDKEIKMKKFYKNSLTSSGS